MWVRSKTVMVMSSVLFTAGCAGSAITPSGREATRDAERAAAIAALAAPGFLSWDTLVAELIPNLHAGRDPLSL